MMYISKGIVKEGSTQQRLTVCYGGCEFELVGREAQIWLDGRFGVASILDTADQQVGHLHRMGLLEFEYEATPLARYRLLTRCILVPSRRGGIPLFQSKTEKRILFWLRNAGIRLSTAELVYLIDREVKPVRGLMHEDNRQALIERIYTKGTIADDVLETQMEKAVFRDEIVESLLRLIAKKRLVVL